VIARVLGQSLGARGHLLVRSGWDLTSLRALSLGIRGTEGMGTAVPHSTKPGVMREVKVIER